VPWLGERLWEVDDLTGFALLHAGSEGGPEAWGVMFGDVIMITRFGKYSLVCMGN
jgi:hypothetical protein